MRPNLDERTQNPRHESPYTRTSTTPPPAAQPPGLRCRQIALSAPLRPPPFRLARSSPSPSGTDLQTSLRQETNVRAHRQGGCELRGAASGGCANVPAHAVEAAAASPSTLTTQLRPRMRRPDANRLGGQETRDPLHHVTAPASRHNNVVFPSSSSLNGHPGRPGKRATGGGARPGARGPGRGPTVVWAQPGCWGFLPPRLQSEEFVGWPELTL